MFVYYNPNQEKNDPFCGPDVLIVLNPPKRDREAWVIWEEGFQITKEMAGFRLHNGRYSEIIPDSMGNLRSEQLNLSLTQWYGRFEEEKTHWFTLGTS